MRIEQCLKQWSSDKPMIYCEHGALTFKFVKSRELTFVIAQKLGKLGLELPLGRLQHVRRTSRHP